MKKILLLFSSLIMVIGLCACGEGGLFASPTPTPVPVVSPTDVLAVSDVAEFVGYEVVADGDIIDDGESKSVVYVSSPKGAKDSVSVKVVQFSDTLSKDEIWNRYENGRVKRSSAEFVEGLGTDAYIAFPSVHIYDRGCEIIISAGSGSDDEQKELLKRIGERAVMNFQRIITVDDTAENQ